MKKNIKVIVNGKPYEVEIENLDSASMSVVVNGETYDVAVEMDESAAPVAASAAAAQPVSAAPVRRAAPAKPSMPAAAASGDSLVAPMPGVVMDIAVKAGDKVAYGQPMCALEAMKMKNAIRAPRDLTIASVEVQEGQRVNYGDVLFKFSA